MYNVRLNYKLFFLIVLLSACADEHTGLNRAIVALDKHQLSTGSYVIIPNQGCEGCISTAEAFVKNNIGKSDSIRYIFTRIQSAKLLRIKLGSNVISSSKVLLDTANMIEYPDKGKEIYPMIVTVKDHQIRRIAYQSPDDEGLSALLGK
ncbi:hypothetical protein [Chitinophaga filiformis]|uniref:NlpE N-terminal domain-containing protein n=1 Tax=Chitinophaga filiformis TaxID=104663 RepID=A0ABY4HYP0_CHIFI|nr:hypothetical protein [Chitinophaga filiformis]UPK68520.1 hypothetical protein MYF79_26545 [Chitinophaga filiformis]